MNEFPDFNPYPVASLNQDVRAVANSPISSLVGSGYGNSAVVQSSPAPVQSSSPSGSTIAPTKEDRTMLYAAGAAALAIVGVALYMRKKKKRR